MADGRHAHDFPQPQQYGAVLTLSILLEVAALYVFQDAVRDDVFPVLSLGLHVAASAVFLMKQDTRPPKPARREGDDPESHDQDERSKSHKREMNAAFYHRLSFLLTLFLPVFGLCGLLFAFFAMLVLFQRKGLAESYQEGFKLEEMTYMLDEDDDIENYLRDEVSIEPIVDILAGDDDNLKRGSISYLRRLKNPLAVGLIKKCLADDSVEIRFYAHTALTRIEEDFTDELQNAMDAVEKLPSPANHRNLAKAYRLYALSGLPEDSMRTSYLEEARRNYELAFKGMPDSAGILLQLGYINNELGDYEEARFHLEKAIEHRSTQVDACLELCRLHYEQENIEALTKLTNDMQKMDDLFNSDPNKVALFHFWAGSDNFDFDPVFADQLAELSSSEAAA